MDAEKQERGKPRTGPGPVMRLRVQYRDGRWRVVQRVEVAEMTVPGSQELLRVRPHRRLAGFWFEVVDAQGEVLYRHGLRPPVPGVEVFEPGGAISRASIEGGIEGYTIDVLVPDLPRVKDVRLFYEGPEVPRVKEKEAVGAAAPVGIFPVREEERRQGRKKGGEGDGNE